VAITMLQILCACILSGQSNLKSAYATLYAWDGGWYQGIIENGYHSPPVLRSNDLGNVAFFPAYPLTAKLVQMTLGVSTEHALLFTAQLACVGMWTFLLLFFQRWRVPRGLAAVAVVLVAIHPAAFFLVASYSESLFLFALLGFLYWADTDRSGARLWTCGFGILMTASRFVGAPLVIYPLLKSWLHRAETSGYGDRWSWKQALPPLIVGGVGVLGALSFFVFCQLRFGQWNVYMKTSEVGWQVHPDYAALFSTRIFHIHWPSLSEPGGDSEYLSRLCVPLILLELVLFLAIEGRRRMTDPAANWRSRAGYYACAALMFYICASGHATRGMSSMVRFALPIQVMFVLAAVHLARDRWEQGWFRSRRAAALFALWCLTSILCQLGMTYRFTHWLWVA
jgi:hypothetical protein